MRPRSAAASRSCSTAGWPAVSAPRILRHFTARFEPLAESVWPAVAIYRVSIEGWSKADAIDEMTQGGFGFKPLWTHLVRHVESLDVERVRPPAPQGKPPR